MPVPQAFVCNREVRFTLRLRLAITIARTRSARGEAAATSGGGVGQNVGMKKPGTSPGM